MAWKADRRTESPGACARNHSIPIRFPSRRRIPLPDATNVPGQRVHDQSYCRKRSVARSGRERRYGCAQRGSQRCYVERPRLLMRPQVTAMLQARIRDRRRFSCDHAGLPPRLKLDRAPWRSSSFDRGLYIDRGRASELVSIREEQRCALVILPCAVQNSTPRSACFLPVVNAGTELRILCTKVYLQPSRTPPVLCTEFFRVHNEII